MYRGCAMIFWASPFMTYVEVSLVWNPLRRRARAALGRFSLGPRDHDDRRQREFTLLSFR